MKNIKHLKSSVSAAALVEYVVLVGLVGVVSIGVTLSLGDRVKRTFETTSNTLSTTGVLGGRGSSQEAPLLLGENTFSVPPIGDCQVLTGPGNIDARSYSAAECFSYSSPGNDDFIFSMDERVIYMDGYNNADPEATVNGDAGDNIAAVVRGSNGYFEFFGGSGEDILLAEGWNSSQMEIIDLGGGGYGIEFYDGPDMFSSTDSNSIFLENVEYIQTEDLLIHRDDFGDYIGEFGPGPGPGPEPGPEPSCPIGSGGPGVTETITIGPSGSPDIEVSLGDGDDILHVYYTSTEDMAGGAQSNVFINMGCGENEIIFHDEYVYTTEMPYSSGPNQYGNPNGIVEFNLNSGYSAFDTDWVIGNSDGFGGFPIMISGPSSFVDGSGEVYNNYPTPEMP